MVSNPANYQGLSLVLYLEKREIDSYVFALRNVGALDLWSVRLELEDVIGPGAYGLDDTHMRRAPNADCIELPQVLSGSTHRLREGARQEVAGMKVAGIRVYVSFSVRSDGESRFAQRVVVEEAGNAH